MSKDWSLTNWYGGQSGFGRTSVWGNNNILPDEEFRRRHFTGGTARRFGPFNKVVLEEEEEEIPIRKPKGEGAIFICGYTGSGTTRGLQYYTGDLTYDSATELFTSKWDKDTAWTLSDSIVSRRISEKEEEVGETLVDPNWDASIYGGVEWTRFDDAASVDVTDKSDWREEIFLNKKDYFIYTPFPSGVDYIKRFDYQSLTKSSYDGVRNTSYYKNLAKDFFEPQIYSNVFIKKGAVSNLAYCEICNEVYGPANSFNLKKDNFKTIGVAFENVNTKLVNAYTIPGREYYIEGEKFIPANAVANFIRSSFNDDEFHNKLGQYISCLTSFTAQRIGEDKPLKDNLTLSQIEQEDYYLLLSSKELDITSYEYDPNVVLHLYGDYFSLNGGAGAVNYLEPNTDTFTRRIFYNSKGTKYYFKSNTLAYQSFETMHSHSWFEGNPYNHEEDIKQNDTEKKYTYSFNYSIKIQACIFGDIIVKSYHKYSGFANYLCVYDKVVSDVYSAYDKDGNFYYPQTGEDAARMGIDWTRTYQRLDQTPELNNFHHGVDYNYIKKIEYTINEYKLHSTVGTYQRTHYTPQRYTFLAQKIEKKLPRDDLGEILIYARRSYDDDPDTYITYTVPGYSSSAGYTEPATTKSYKKYRSDALSYGIRTSTPTLVGGDLFGFIYPADEYKLRVTSDGDHSFSYFYTFFSDKYLDKDYFNNTLRNVVNKKIYDFDISYNVDYYDEPCTFDYRGALLRTSLTNKTEYYDWNSLEGHTAFTKTGGYTGKYNVILKGYAQSFLSVTGSSHHESRRIEGSFNVARTIDDENYKYELIWMSGQISLEWGFGFNEPYFYSMPLIGPSIAWSAPIKTRYETQPYDNFTDNFSNPSGTKTTAAWFDGSHLNQRFGDNSSHTFSANENTNKILDEYNYKVGSGTEYVCHFLRGIKNIDDADTYSTTLDEFSFNKGFAYSSGLLKSKSKTNYFTHWLKKRDGIIKLNIGYDWNVSSIKSCHPIMRPWHSNIITFTGLVPDTYKNKFVNFATDKYEVTLIKSNTYNRFYKTGTAYQNYLTEGIYPNIQNGNVYFVNAWLSSIFDGLSGIQIKINDFFVNNETIRFSNGFNLPCDTALISELTPNDLVIKSSTNILTEEYNETYGYTTKKGIFPIIKSFWQSKSGDDISHRISNAIFSIETQHLIEGPNYYFSYSANQMPPGLEEGYNGYKSRGLIISIGGGGTYDNYFISDASGFFNYFKTQNTKRYPINAKRAYDDYPVSGREEVGYYWEFEEAFNRTEISSAYTFETQLAAKMSFGVRLGNNTAVLFMLAYDIDKWPTSKEDTPTEYVHPAILPEEEYKFRSAFLTAEFNNDILIDAVSVPKPFEDFQMMETLRPLVERSKKYSTDKKLEEAGRKFAKDRETKKEYEGITIPGSPKDKDEKDEDGNLKGDTYDLAAIKPTEILPQYEFDEDQTIQDELKISRGVVRLVRWRTYTWREPKLDKNGKAISNKYIQHEDAIAECAVSYTMDKSEYVDLFYTGTKTVLLRFYRDDTKVDTTKEGNDTIETWAGDVHIENMVIPKTICYQEDVSTEAEILKGKRSFDIYVYNLTKLGIFDIVKIKEQNTESGFEFEVLTIPVTTDTDKTYYCVSKDCKNWQVTGEVGAGFLSHTAAGVKENAI